MKLRVVSDLHTEFWNRSPVLMHEVLPHMDTDKETVLCIAGDLGLLHRPETWLHILKDMAARFKAVVYVAGNHEFYHNTYFDRIDMLKDGVKLPKNVHFLENGSAVIDEEVMFIGASLWTDLNHGQEFYLDVARRAMMDYRCIKWETGFYLAPIETVNAHRQSRNYIFTALDENLYEYEKDMYKEKYKTVVLTHHMPSYQCVSERFKGDLLNCAFCSELGPEIEKYQPNLWLFGHTHDSHDSMIGNTRLLCNPYGYYMQEVNPKYNNKLVIEV